MPRCVLLDVLLFTLPTPSLAAGLVSSDSGYAFDAGHFPRYEMLVTVDGPKQLLAVNGEVTVPRQHVRDGKVIFALTEAAQQVETELVEPTGRRIPVKPALRKQDDVPAATRRWTLPLTERLAASKKTLRITFRYRIEKSIATVYTIGPQVSFAAGTNVAWYPQVERADGVRMPGLGSMRIDAGRQLVIAGGGSGRGKLHSTSAPRHFAFSAATYRVVTGRSGRTRLYLLTDRPAMSAFADRMDSVIAALEKLFGPLPQQHFDLAEVPTSIARAAGFDGALLDGFMLAGDFYFDQPFNTAFFGHELGHQWWGALIRRHPSSGAYLLDESLAQFGSLAAVADVEGERAAELYRRRGFPGYYAEYSGFQFLARSLDGIDAPLTSLPVEDGFLARRVANSKGMIVWSMLADTMGPARFAAFLQSFVRSHAYSWITVEEFLTALRFAMTDQAWFIDEWLTRRGAADYALSWTTNGGELRIRIAQEPVYRALILIEIRLRDGTGLQQVVDAREASTEHVVTVAGEVTSVTLDPSYRVLRWTPEYRAEAQAILPYTRGDIALNNGHTDEADAIFRTALKDVGDADPFGLRTRLQRGLGDVALSRSRPQDAVSHYLRALAASPKVPEQLPELLLALADAHRLAGDERAASAATTCAAETTRKLWTGSPLTEC